MNAFLTLIYMKSGETQMVNVILTSHGSYAEGIREAAEMILGEQDDLEVFGLFPGETFEDFAARMEKAVIRFNDPEHTLIMADLTCGTPSNMTMMMVLKYHVHALIGMNLPMVIEVLSTRNDGISMEELKRNAIQAAVEGVTDVNTLLEESEDRV